MNAPHAATAESARFELRFPALPSNADGLAFPCDERGNVDLDRLSDKARNDYFYARKMRRILVAAAPAVCPAMH